MAVLKMNDSVLEMLMAARSVMSDLELDKTLSLVLKEALELTKTTTGSIALYTPATGRMLIHARKGFSRDFLACREWKVRRGSLADRLLRSRSVMVLNGPTDRRFFGESSSVRHAIKSVIYVPLIYRQVVIGILALDDGRKRKFPPSMLRSLEILGSFAAIAIHHARSYRHVKQLAITDGLTGLFNRRYFEDILSREFQRAARHRREFSLALVDVDDFKKFNDAYGHPAGDEALTALGEAIRASVRSTDLAARYGGDEMAIVLPETKLVKAYNLFATRIKREIEDRFGVLCRGRYRLTVTIGIASYPQDGENALDLVLSADKALLAAKKEKHSRRIGCARTVSGTLLTTP